MKNTLNTTPRVLVLALGLALTAGSALADSTASGTLGNVHITLTDLDPNDGITPSLSINFGSQPYLNGAVGSYGPGFIQDGYAHLGKNASSTVTDSIQAPFASSSATMIGANTVAGIGSMTVAGSATSGTVGFGEFGALAANYTSSQFVLSPNTAITITVDATLNVQTTLGYDPLTGNLEHASGHVLMFFDGTATDGSSLYTDAGQDLYVDAAMDSNGKITGAKQSWSGTLDISFANASSQSIVGNFYSELSVGGLSMAVPSVGTDPAATVPEPSTYALLLGGLGVVGGIARRRKTARQD
ncbi:PEP-CTERM sorting domain-containing protein [Paucibacter sp. R3-3]|uniref:PEP-CTERM sorting domain-containing protein n=1 Tax=Roseateles agri TaxID=3098619 RepID=A0ABU5DGG9_9BURK|nr:PEP-CTERM sorting domain-containing protein [Paucibacter sp. R3-3]MDY0744374.1 PEP-CTERM sorting domain-containing protein [Paucibacter sp. R3-3]